MRGTTASERQLMVMLSGRKKGAPASGMTLSPLAMRISFPLSSRTSVWKESCVLPDSSVTVVVRSSARMKWPLDDQRKELTM